MITTILIFIVVLAILVFVHEFGHFIVARKSGMKVDEFGFGFPPRIAGIQKIDGKLKMVWGHKAPLNPEQTVYSINLIPLGGFVKIVGENNEAEQDPRSFINRPFKNRFAVLVAGVVMNVILAWVLISAGYMIGLPVAFDSLDQLPANATFSNPSVAVLDVVKNLPADKAGFKPNDIIVSINNNKVSTVEEVQKYVKEHAGEKIAFELKRGQEVVLTDVDSVANPPPGEGPTGIGLANIGKLRYPWYSAIWEGSKTVGTQISGIFSGIYHLFTSGLGLSSLGGPVKIAQLTGQVAGLGFIYLLQFTAFLSLNLAVLNILPFPALDGGRVLFLVIEKIRGKRNNQRLEQIVNAIGFVFLLLLMIAVTVKDVFVK